MKLDNSNVKEKIFRTVLDLVSENVSISTITTRQIAQRANVNLALINYYYQSKENLLSLVAQTKMDSLILEVLNQSFQESDPKLKLKNLLCVTADYSFKHNELFKISVMKELKEGCKNSLELFIPILKEIYNNKTELEIKIIALQLLLPFHNIVLYPEVYNKIFRTNFFDDQKRSLMINQMVDSIINL